jgi:hypothetical protein
MSALIILNLLMSLACFPHENHCLSFSGFFAFNALLRHGSFALKGEIKSLFVSNLFPAFLGAVNGLTMAVPTN